MTHINQNRFWFILFLTCLLLTANSAQADDCPAYETPTINISPLYVQPVYDDSVTLRQIRQYADQPNTVASKHEIPVGLTAANLSFKTSFTVSSSRGMLDSTYCAQISNFNMKFGFDNVRVYLARELPSNSCASQLVRDHENRHVATDRAILNEYLPQMQDLVKQKLATIGVIRASSPAMAEAKLQDMIRDFTTGLGNRISQVRESQQQKIDTPEEYRRLSTECGGQISRIVSGQ